MGRLRVSPWIYGANVPVNLSTSTIQFRVYLPAQFAGSGVLANSGCWLSLDGPVTGNNVQIWLNNLNTLVAGWNTVSINFADSRLNDTQYVSVAHWDYTQVNDVNIGIGSRNTAVQGLAVPLKIDYFDIVPN